MSYCLLLWTSHLPWEYFHHLFVGGSTKGKLENFGNNNWEAICEISLFLAFPGIVKQTNCVQKLSGASSPGDSAAPEQRPVLQPPGLCSWVRAQLGSDSWVSLKSWWLNFVPKQPSAERHSRLRRKAVSLLQMSLLVTFSEAMTFITWVLTSTSEFFHALHLELPNLKIHSLSLDQECHTCCLHTESIHVN